MSAIKRREAREIVIGLLFESEFRADEGYEEIYASSVEEREIPEDPYIRNAYYGIFENQEIIDQRIGQNAHGWKTNRMTKLSRSILRLAVYEMLYSGHIAQKGAINEAVEMAKIYGKKESSGFINSVLDKVMKNEERKDSIVTEAAKEAMAEAPIKEDEKVTMIIEREVTEEEAEAILAGKIQ